MIYYSTNEVSKMLGLKIKTIQKLIRDKKNNSF